MNPWTAHVLGRVRRDPAVEVGEAVVPAHGEEPPVDRGCREPASVQPRPVQLNMGSGGLERLQTNVVSPLEELAQVGPIGLQRAAAVAGEERSRSELGLIQQRELGSQHRWGHGTGLEHGHLNLLG
jgi:hypothetical protein